MYDYVLIGELLKYVDENCDWYLILFFIEELFVLLGIFLFIKLVEKNCIWKKNVWMGLLKFEFMF